MQSDEEVKENKEKKKRDFVLVETDKISIRSSSSENSMLENSVFANKVDYSAYDLERSTSFQQSKEKTFLISPKSTRQMAFISGSAQKSSIFTENASRRSVGLSSPLHKALTLKAPSFTNNKGRMSLSPPATIPRGPNLQTTTRSNRKSVLSNFSGGFSMRSGEANLN